MLILFSTIYGYYLNDTISGQIVGQSTVSWQGPFPSSSSPSTVMWNLHCISTCSASIRGAFEAGPSSRELSLCYRRTFFLNSRRRWYCLPPITTCSWKVYDLPISIGHKASPARTYDWLLYHHLWKSAERSSLKAGLTRTSKPLQPVAPCDAALLPVQWRSS